MKTEVKDLNTFAFFNGLAVQAHATFVRNRLHVIDRPTHLLLVLNENLLEIVEDTFVAYIDDR